jgi:hypothetical protein
MTRLSRQFTVSRSAEIQQQTRVVPGRLEPTQQQSVGGSSGQSPFVHIGGGGQSPFVHIGGGGQSPFVHVGGGVSA